MKDQVRWLVRGLGWPQNLSRRFGENVLNLSGIGPGHPAYVPHVYPLDYSSSHGLIIAFSYRIHNFIQWRNFRAVMNYELVREIKTSRNTRKPQTSVNASLNDTWLLSIPMKSVDLNTPITFTRIRAYGKSDSFPSVTYTLNGVINMCKDSRANKKTPWPLVRKRTIPTERRPLIGEI
jgi:hypothetical protein